MSRKILVTGATGNQGGAVVEHLLRHGHSVRAFVRDVRTARARRLAAMGAELAQGDYDEPASVVRAARGMHGMFALATPFEDGTQAEFRHGNTLIDSAKAAGIRHFVYSSVASADRHTGIPHFESKHRIELHLKKSGLPFTVVGPTYFRENLLSQLGEIASTGLLTMPLALDRPMQTLCKDDLGVFVAQVFDAGEALAGQRIDIASDETTGPEMAQAFERSLGRQVRYLSEGLESVMTTDDDVARMWAWFNRTGYAADVARLQSEFANIPWKSFDAWVREVVGVEAQPSAP